MSAHTPLFVEPAAMACLTHSARYAMQHLGTDAVRVREKLPLRSLSRHVE